MFCLFFVNDCLLRCLAEAMSVIKGCSRDGRSLMLKCSLMFKNWWLWGCSCLKIVIKVLCKRLVFRSNAAVYDFGCDQSVLVIVSRKCLDLEFFDDCYKGSLLTTKSVGWICGLQLRLWSWRLVVVDRWALWSLLKTALFIEAGFVVVYIYRSFFSTVAGISLLVYEQILFLMLAFRGQFVLIVQACHVGLENYEVFLL